MLNKITGLACALAATLLVPAVSQAYFIAVPANQGPIAYDSTTRILVAGRGTNQFTQFRQSAMTAAYLNKRNFPDQQIVLISVIEAKNDSLAIVAKDGWKIISANEDKFDTASVMTELLKFSKIRALEFFGHNSASLGTQTDGPGYRFDALDPSVSPLASHFDGSAFAYFHGCNSGWLIAESLSKVWGVPVAGSFTETNFEQLNSDGHFYTNDPGKFPASPWAHSNKDLDNVSCSVAGCIRMRPATLPYRSDWGDLAGPFVAHYKFFCQLDLRECEKRMALSLFGFVAEKSLNRHSSKNDFRQAAKEFLCPAPKDRSVTLKCEQQLDLVEQGRGNMHISFAERAYPPARV